MQLSVPGPNSVMPDDRGITFLWNGTVRQQTCTLSKPRRLLSDVMYHDTTFRELELGGGDVRESHIEQYKGKNKVNCKDGSSILFIVQCVINTRQSYSILR